MLLMLFVPLIPYTIPPHLNTKTAEPLKKMEHTFIALKPDCIARRLSGTIISRFEKKGFTLTAMKLVIATENMLRQHYAEHVDKPWFKDFIKFFLNKQIICMVWSGKNIIKESRKMIGATDPQEALMGTIRGDFGVDKGRNLVHGSDSLESAQREIKLWFGDNIDFQDSFDKDQVYEN
ncbi:hypothetical protein EDEG_01884 [Edhazardia aedis USNM 41457]|uniref:Nucleoside diphosphate kinase n=1 Tax=Edhazardia aedis (strain USNM 41457) TaxID=1003232 RepID=J9D7Q2_EDHAE|nr:hypothetical protein EDEG_01884 [Edhazardia aedis USNM 41457]|eukprot:EJW03826.1 hypothetical protein EDEG_01884 [Edhazardia aedis USNM 41457]